MAFKINVSDKGKTYKAETESELLVGKKIGETIQGSDIDSNLTGYELLITGTSDLSGIPGFKGLEGSNYHRRLLTRGPGMKNTSKGLRLRKTNRGEEISSKTHQINTKVVKEGTKKFEELISKPVEDPTEEKSTQEETKAEEKPKEEATENKSE